MKRFPMRALFDHLHIPGPDLLLREFGRQAFPLLEHVLQDVPMGHALYLSFEGISVMDTSFADETVLKLALELVNQQYGDRFLILEYPSPATIDNLEGAIARRKAKIAMLTHDERNTRFIGHVEQNLQQAWQLVYDKGTLTARELANDLGLEINTASMRLRKLHEAHLIARTEEVTTSGRQHLYTLPE
jgi:hypothetical protein